MSYPPYYPGTPGMNMGAGGANPSAPPMPSASAHVSSPYQPPPYPPSSTHGMPQPQLYNSQPYAAPPPPTYYSVIPPAVPPSVAAPYAATHVPGYQPPPPPPPNVGFSGGPGYHSSVPGYSTNQPYGAMPPGAYYKHGKKLKYKHGRYYSSSSSSSDDEYKYLPKSQRKQMKKMKKSMKHLHKFRF